jgi:hypothetical protein
MAKEWAIGIVEGLSWVIHKNYRNTDQDSQSQL